MNIQALINDKVSQALEAAGAPAGSPAAVRQSAKPQFGDYQANGVMGVAKNWVLTHENLHRKYWMF
ncbi:Arginyl-tRNA synthetase [Vibrio sp. B1FIG11]|nr:Arginyl-tRNA synthetase [Vibrio sp. B1FIG11]CAE6919905.1 Arginyl-tRNA synthetase [Vibrio sp. B1FIG11]